MIEFSCLKAKDWLAWWIWDVVCIYFLVGVPSPFIVPIRWPWEYLT